MQYQSSYHLTSSLYLYLNIIIHHIIIITTPPTLSPISIRQLKACGRAEKIGQCANQ